MHFIEELVWECNYTVAKRLVWASNVFGYSTSPSENVDLNPALIKNESKGCFFVLLPIVKSVPQKIVQPLVVLNEKL